MADRRRSRYGRYAGGPDPLAPPVDLAEALDAIGEDVMAGYSPERAMREFLRRGGQNQRGLDDLARQVAAKRRELLQKHSLDGTLEEVRELLDQAVLKERGQLARDVQMDDGDRALRELQLDNLPTSTAAAVSELSSYDWTSREAREDFEKIKDLLGREMLDQRFQGMKDALENATDEDRQRINEMLTDLNELLDKHRRGEDTEQDFADFMDKHGDFFPENPQNIDELMDSLAQRAAAAQRMRNSMTQEQRDELDALAAQAFGSPELMQSLGRLDDNLRSLRPGEDWGGSEEFGGEEGLGLGDGTGVLQDLAELDDLSEQLSQSYGGARMEDVNFEKLSRQLGDEAGVDARTQAAVALLVDTSFSMAMANRWVPMKRTALALHQLISSRFRGDHLQLIGFGRAARVMEIEELTALDAMWDKGTNLHHALLLANRHFRKHPNAQPVLLIVPDGEPTSHLDPDGEVWFSYPPPPLTVAWSVRELDNAARLGAQTTFFRLGDDPGLARFIEQMAARVDGRVVSPELDDLGAAVVGSYLGGRGGGDSGGQLGDWYGGRGSWFGG